MTWLEQVKSRVELIRTGIPADEITGATSVRCAVGLIIGKLEGLTTLNEEDAWNYLDRGNRENIADLRNQYANTGKLV